MTTRGQRFLDQLSNEILVGDGAFGTRFFDKGMPLDLSYEDFNLSRPEVVEEVLREYKGAGAQVLETNTFCSNQIKQARFGLEAHVKQQAWEGAKIARRVAGEDLYVAGSVGPISRRRRELDEYSKDDIKGIFRESMEGLVDGGVDTFYLETFSLLLELELALEVAHEFDIPVICQMAFGEEGTTQSGVTVERATKFLDEKGVDVIGANCRSGPHILEKILELQASVTKRPISVYPNAGYAQQVDGRFIYQASPQYFGEKAIEMVQLGASLLGGCCGTGPDHIREIANAVKDLKPVKHHISFTGKAAETEVVPEKTHTYGYPFMEHLEKDEIFVTVEVEPPKDLNLKKVFDGIRLLTKAGCSALNIPDNPLAIVRADNVIFADLLRQNLDLPVVLHLTCRDKNMIALQSDLLGAQMCGIESVLAITGDPAAIGDQPGASSVYDVNSIGLIEIISGMNHGLNASGGKMKEATNFAIGVAVNSNVSGPKGLDGVFFKLRKKIDAGAQFGQTQPIYDHEVLHNFLKKSKEIEFPICVGLMPIVSHRNAEFMHNEVPGIKIPRPIRDRFKGLDKKAANKLGVKWVKALVDTAFSEGVRNFYLVTPLHKYEMSAELVEYIRGK